MNQIVNLRARGMEFLSAPDSYYDSLRQKLKTAKIKVKEDLKTLQVRETLMTVDSIKQMESFQCFSKCILKSFVLFSNAGVKNLSRLWR